LPVVFVALPLGVSNYPKVLRSIGTTFEDGNEGFVQLVRHEKAATDDHDGI
jgi:hypothetical protein